MDKRYEGLMGFILELDASILNQIKKEADEQFDKIAAYVVANPLLPATIRESVLEDFLNRVDDYLPE